MIATSPRLLLLLAILPVTLIWSGWAESSAALADDSFGCAGNMVLRPQDSLWLIGTRHLGCPHPDRCYNQSFQILRYDESGWQRSDFPSFLSDLRDMTVFYVHGNRVDTNQAFWHGREAYQAVIQAADRPDSIRFVVWSWPSDQICGPRRDVLSKAARTDPESYYLATVLAQLPSTTEAGLFGFSYGARIISGALHLLSGSPLGGYRLNHIERPADLRLRAVLMAAAMDDDWWLPHGYHSQCPTVATRILVQFNPCDPALRFYPRVDRRERPQALGYTGFPWPGSLDDGMFEQQNVSSQLGKTHDASKYFGSETIMQRARQVLLPPLPAQPQ
jgi:hypothetical protein